MKLVWAPMPVPIVLPMWCGRKLRGVIDLIEDEGDLLG
jgi:hypothetical protein